MTGICTNCNIEMESTTQVGYVSRDTDEAYCVECTDKLFTKCHACDKVLNYLREYGHTDGNDNVYCRECTASMFSVCDCCGRYVMDHEEHYDTMELTVYGTHVCQTCFDRDFAVCNECGETYHMSDTTEVEGAWYCNDCLETEFTQCQRCERYIPNEDVYTTDYGDSLCERCYIDEQEEESIASYHSGHPRGLQFFKHHGSESHLYMGMELEVDKGGERKEVADDVCRRLGTYWVHCEHDGSLSNGFEIITQPSHVQYIQDKIRYIMPEVVRMLLDEDYRSHETTTCGLHLHVSKLGLGSDENQRIATIAKIYIIMENVWDDLVTFSRRTEAQLARWAAKYDAEIDVEKDTTEEIVGKLYREHDRYRALNLRNSDTIEFRMFRGTLNINTILATIQLVYGIVTVAMTHRMHNVIEIKTMDTLIRQIYTMCDEGTLGTELKDYASSRGLYTYPQPQQQQQQQQEQVA